MLVLCYINLCFPASRFPMLTLASLFSIAITLPILPALPTTVFLFPDTSFTSHFLRFPYISCYHITKITTLPCYRSPYSPCSPRSPLSSFILHFSNNLLQLL